MSKRIFRSPKSGSAAAATTPCRLAREFGGSARWRELPDGRIEVAFIRDNGYLERHVVLEDGQTSCLGSYEPGAGWSWGGHMLAVGLVLTVCAFLVLMVTDASGAALALTPFFGLALAGIGGHARYGAKDV